jgi:hypothetical protein
MAEVIQELGIELTLAKDLLAPWLAIDLTQETSCVSHQRSYAGSLSPVSSGNAICTVLAFEWIRHGVLTVVVDL